MALLPLIYSNPWRFAFDVRFRHGKGFTHLNEIFGNKIQGELLNQ